MSGGIMIKSFRSLLLLAALAVVTTAFAPMLFAYSVDVSVNEKAMSFIREVIQLDFSKYSVEVRDYFEEYSAGLGRTVKKDITYTFTGEGSKLHVSCRFANETLYDCFVRVDEGLAFYVQPSADPSALAVGILERYRRWTGDGSLDEILGVLKTVDTSKNVTVKKGNWTFKVLITAESTWLSWLYTVNGVTFPNCIGIAVEKNGEISFYDERKLYRIGSTDVKISRDEAVAIALKHVENYSFEIFMGDKPPLVVRNFTIVKEKIAAELLSWAQGGRRPIPLLEGGLASRPPLPEEHIHDMRERLG
jgi:hypothetical protein